MLKLCQQSAQVTFYIALLVSVDTLHGVGGGGVGGGVGGGDGGGDGEDGAECVGGEGCESGNSDGGGSAL